MADGNPTRCFEFRCRCSYPKASQQELLLATLSREGISGRPIPGKVSLSVLKQTAAYANYCSSKGIN